MDTLSVKKPHLTEKTLAQAARGWFTFVVEKASNKREIARDVEKQYGVNVTDVRTSMRRGKERRVGKKLFRVTTPDIKRAIVQLASGQSIPAFEVTREGEKK